MPAMPPHTLPTTSVMVSGDIGLEGVEGGAPRRAHTTTHCRTHALRSAAYCLPCRELPVGT